MTLTPVAFNLTNVTLYVNTTSDLSPSIPTRAAYELTLPTRPRTTSCPAG